MATAQQAPAGARSGQIRFDGFISYSHTADDLLAPRLQTALQTFAKPRRRDTQLGPVEHCWR